MLLSVLQYLSVNTVEIESQGNSKYYYSSQAIANAQMNLKSSRFEVLSWWE
jgi:hypothetical protein